MKLLMEPALGRYPEYYLGFGEWLIEWWMASNEAFMKHIQNGTSPTMVLKCETSCVPVAEKLKKLHGRMKKDFESVEWSKSPEYTQGDDRKERIRNVMAGLSMAIEIVEEEMKPNP